MWSQRVEATSGHVEAEEAGLQKEGGDACVPRSGEEGELRKVTVALPVPGSSPSLLHLQSSPASLPDYGLQ